MPNDVNENSLADLKLLHEQLDTRTKRLWIPGRRQQLATERYRLGCEFAEQGHVELALVNLQRAIELFAAKKPSRSKNSRASFEIVASSHNRMGLVYLAIEDMPKATENFRAAVDLRRRLQKLYHDDFKNNVDLGGSLCNLGVATAAANSEEAADYFQQALDELRTTEKPCECSYWDEERQTWWCEQLEALGRATGFCWVDTAASFIDNAQAGLDKLSSAK